MRAASGSTKAKTGSLTVTFKAPASNGGPSIIRYTAKCTSANGGVTRSGTHSGSTAAPVTVGPATTGKAYKCTVTATSNGSPVTSYTASCASGNGGATHAKSGTGSPLTVTGLTAGKRYTCTVTAANARGKGPASSASGSVTASLIGLVILRDPCGPVGLSAPIGVGWRGR